MGNGGQVPEDDSIETGFKTEQSRSAITAGVTLYSEKTKGLSDKGDAEKHYKAIQRVKQGFSEAILQEQIPPGYHDGIKKYFDKLDSPKRSGQTAPAKSDASPPATPPENKEGAGEQKEAAEPKS